MCSYHCSLKLKYGSIFFHKYCIRQNFWDNILHARPPRKGRYDHGRWWIWHTRICCIKKNSGKWASAVRLMKAIGCIWRWENQKNWWILYCKNYQVYHSFQSSNHNQHNMIHSYFTITVNYKITSFNIRDGHFSLYLSIVRIVMSQMK